MQADGTDLRSELTTRGKIKANLDRQTGKVTNMLRGLANTVRTHRASPKVVA